MKNVLKLTATQKDSFNCILVRDLEGILLITLIDTFEGIVEQKSDFSISAKETKQIAVVISNFDLFFQNIPLEGQEGVN